MQLPSLSSKLPSLWLWLALISPLASPAQNDVRLGDLWTPVEWAPFSAQASLPTAYAAASLDLRMFLGRLPASPSAAGEATFPATTHLLLPDGSLALIAIKPEIAIDPEIAAAFPDLQTYSFESLPNREISGQLRMGPGGIYAFGRTNDRLLRIEPVQTASGVYYLSYFDCDRTVKVGTARATPTLLVSRR